MKESDFDNAWIPEPNSGCWIWIKSIRNDGYGQVRFRGKMDGAHRASWLIYRGQIPDGLQVLHRCDTPSCVNPDHLFIGTNTDNMRDAALKKRFHQSGENNGASKLTEQDVLIIRIATGLQREIGLRFGISQQCVSLIRSKKRWNK